MTDITSPIDLGPHQVGEEVLGPLYQEVFTRLHAYARPHDPATRRLFVARAGVRLQHLYRVFCEARGLQPADSEILWISRLLATKALYGVDDDLFHQSVLREFRNASIQDFARAMSRHSGPLGLGPLRKQPLRRMKQLLENRRMERLHAFLTAEGEAARAYLKTTLGDPTETVFLIDSGWHGTIHRLLMPNARAELVSLLVARVRREGEAAPPGHQLVGLLLEADGFEADRPESALVFHRHLIEAPLEPPSPSIERVVLATDGSFIFPEAERSGDVEEHEPRDQMYLGIEKYLRTAGDRSLYQTQSAFVVAVDRLASSILYPRAGDVSSLDMGQRSSDFGRNHFAPVLLDPVARRKNDSADLRIRDSLWPQGQAVVELGEHGAKNVHKKLAGTLSEEDYFHPWRRLLAQKPHGVVAVVTRTKDRPILLRRAADSVSSQSYPHVHWVVVNDGGDLDPVLEVIRASEMRRSAITVVSHAVSVGMEAASNAGVAAVDSTFITIHDDDDSWSPRFLEETVSFLCDREDEYVGVITHTTRVSEQIVSGEVVVRSTRPYNSHLKSIGLAEMAVGNMYAPIAFLFTRSVYESAGGFPEDLPVLGDWDFNLRVLSKGDIGVLPKPLAFYHHRDIGVPMGYGNSVVAARDKHIEFEAKVRNGYLRRAMSDGSLGHLAMMGYAVKTVRDEARQSRAKFREISGTTSPAIDADRLWWALAASVSRHRYRVSMRDVLLEHARRERPRAVELTPQLVETLIAQLDPGEVPVSPDFDEAAYLRQNPDVRKAVKNPQHPLRSGWHHYLSRGKSEGRPRATRRTRS